MFLTPLIVPTLTTIELGPIDAAGDEPSTNIVAMIVMVSSVASVRSNLLHRRLPLIFSDDEWFYHPESPIIVPKCSNKIKYSQYHYKSFYRPLICYGKGVY